MSPADLAAQALRVSPSHIRSVEPIKHGLTNASWLVRTLEDAVVVRVSNAHAEHLRIDRRSELAVLRAVAAAGIGAPVLYAHADGAVLVTRFAGPQWTAMHVTAPGNLQRLAARLAQLHELAAPPEARRLDLQQTVAGYQHTLDTFGVHESLRTTALAQRAEQSARRLTQDAPRLCHNDVHHLNIVEDAQLTLIDWEYAGLGPALFDLASLCVYEQLDAPCRRELLAYYGEAGGKVIGAALDEACWLFEYVRDLWTAVRGL